VLLKTKGFKMFYKRLTELDSKVRCTDGVFDLILSDILLSYIAHINRAEKLSNFTNDKFRIAMSRVYDRNFSTTDELLAFLSSTNGVRTADGTTRLGLLISLIKKALSEVL